jgi:hypothetical protein
MDLAAQEESQKSYSAQDVCQQARLQAKLQTEMRKNTFDVANNTITVSECRAQAIAQSENQLALLVDGLTTASNLIGTQAGNDGVLLRYIQRPLRPQIMRQLGELIVKHSAYRWRREFKISVNF